MVVFPLMLFHEINVTKLYVAGRPRHSQQTSPHFSRIKCLLEWISQSLDSNWEKARRTWACHHWSSSFNFDSRRTAKFRQSLQMSLHPHGIYFFKGKPSIAPHSADTSWAIQLKVLDNPTLKLKFQQTTYYHAG